MTDSIIKIDNIPNFDYTKNAVVEASAGTGKTYTIIQIIPYLLARGYKLSEILIVTYMEKAAGELRSRIRNELVKLVHNEQIPNDLKNNLLNELENIDNAPIFTFHSFCQKTLTENAIYSNCSQNMALVDEDACLDNFVGKYIRDNAVNNPDLVYLYQNSPKDKYTNAKTIQVIIKNALKKYYLDKNGCENPDVISLDNTTQSEKEIYDNTLRVLRENQKNSTVPEAICYFVKTHLKDMYMAWQKEKQNKNQQTYTDMLTIIHNAITDKSSALLQKLREKYKYAIIDEFQDTNQLQWNIFKQIFGYDTHHIVIVGDPKQSICSFQGADPAIYNIAKQYIISGGGVEYKITTNYRSSGLMIQAVNELTKNADICDFSKIGGYQDAQIPQNKKIEPAQLNNKNEIPVHFIHTPPENTITSVIKRYCNEKLQIWDKNLKKYRDVNYGDFAVLVRKRRNADKITQKMNAAKIPFMWHKDPIVSTTKEVIDWIAVLSAISANDFNASNRHILHRALLTAFFDISKDEINDEKYDDILCKERQILLKWHNLAETRQCAKLLNAIFEDSNISKRLATYDKIQSLAKYNQIGNFVLDCMLSKNSSLATVIKKLKQQNYQRTDMDTMLVEKATDSPTVKISTIHSAKGLEFPIVFYVVNKKRREIDFVRIKHTPPEQKAILEITPKNTEDSDWDTLNYVAITRASSLLYIVNDKDENVNEHVIKQYPELFALCDGVKSNEQNSYPQNLTCNDVVPEKPGKIALSDKKLYKHSYTSLSHKQNGNDDVDDFITEKNQRVNKEEFLNFSEFNSTKKYDSDSVVKILGIYDANKLPDIPSNSCSGKQYGNALHEVFEYLDFKSFETNDKNMYESELNRIINVCCKKYAIPQVNNHNYIADLVKNTMTAKLPEIIGNRATGNSFSLSNLSQKDKKSETEFNFDFYIGDNDTLKNYCNGFMDLLFVREIDGNHVYSVLDWKSDLLTNQNGDVSPASYADYDCLKLHTDNNYAIQRVLYSYCLIQWLATFYPNEKSLDEIFNNHFGGIYYAYVRGCGVGTGNGIYAHTWESYTALENAFNRIKGIIKENRNG